MKDRIAQSFGSSSVAPAGDSFVSAPSWARVGAWRVVAVDSLSTPLYTVAEAAHYLGVPDQRFLSWVKGYARRSDGRADVRGNRSHGGPGSASSPRRRCHSSGWPRAWSWPEFGGWGCLLRRIRPAVQVLKDEPGIAHVLASRSLHTDVADELYDFAERSGESDAQEMRQLVCRHGQLVFNEVVDQRLRRVEFADDGYARLIRLPGYQAGHRRRRPDSGFGQPIFGRGGASVEDALSVFWSGGPWPTWRSSTECPNLSSRTRCGSLPDTPRDRWARSRPSSLIGVSGTFSSVISCGRRRSSW